MNRIKLEELNANGSCCNNDIEIRNMNVKILDVTRDSKIKKKC